MTGGATAFVVDCYVFGIPPLDFDGAGRRRRHPRPYQPTPSIGTGADGPQAEERAKAADAHRIAPVPCDAEALKKNTVCPVVKKRSRQIALCGFLFDQSILDSTILNLLGQRSGASRLIVRHHCELLVAHF